MQQHDLAICVAEYRGNLSNFITIEIFEKEISSPLNRIACNIVQYFICEPEYGFSTRLF